MRSAEPRLSIREPIIESAYRALVEASRDEYVEIGELAGFSASSHRWSDADYVETEDGQQLSDRAWDGAVAEEEGKIRDLVAQGRLGAKGRGRSLKIRTGDF